MALKFSPSGRKSASIPPLPFEGRGDGGEGSKNTASPLANTSWTLRIQHPSALSVLRVAGAFHRSPPNPLPGPGRGEPDALSARKSTPLAEPPGGSLRAKVPATTPPTPPPARAPSVRNSAGGSRPNGVEVLSILAKIALNPPSPLRGDRPAFRPKFLLSFLQLAGVDRGTGWCGPAP